MDRISDISSSFALRLQRAEQCRARQVVAELARVARLDGDLVRARLATSIAARLEALEPHKGQMVDLRV
jgi:hypothetical protein